MTDTDQKIAELKAATREANEVLKDLRRETKVALDLLKVIDEAASVAVNTRIEPVVQKGLDDFAGSLKAAIDNATERVYKRFDTIGDILMGEDRASRRKGKPPLTELAKKRADGRR